MKKSQFECFISVMENKSIKNAAEKLFISPQAVSKAIIELENQLNEPLFTRTGKTLIPTPKAYRVEKHIRTILNEYNNIFDYEAKYKKSTLYVVLTFNIFLLLKADFFVEFKKQYPDIVITIIDTSDKEAMRRIESGEIEIGILTGPIHSQSLTKTFLFKRNFIGFLRKDSPYANIKCIDDHIATSATLALCGGKEFNTYEPCMSRYIDRGCIPNIIIESTSSTLIRELVHNNLAIGICLDYIAENIVTEHEKIVPLEDTEIITNFYLVYKKDYPLTNEAKIFKNFLANWIHQLNS